MFPYKSGAGLPIWYLIVVYKSSLSLGDFVGFFYKDVIAKSIYCILKPKQVLKNPDIVSTSQHGNQIVSSLLF